MRSFTSAATFIAFSALLATAAPTKRQTSSGGVTFPLADGFPNPSPPQTTQIQQAAQGILPNGSPPNAVNPDSLINLQLIAYNEIFEVAYFTELIGNITNNVHGYDQVPNRDFVLKTLNAVLAQEQLHALNANGALKHFGAAPILPCQYNFPVANFADAIALAATFTDVVMGTLQDVIVHFAKNGDSALTRGIASVIGQEGEQEGWYRLVGGKIPNALPFLSASVRDFTAVTGFTVPGSCPNSNTIPLKLFAPLAVLTPPPAADATIKFSFQPPAGIVQQTPLWITYINQQNTPVTQPFTADPSSAASAITGSAFFPYGQFEMNGLTIAAVTKSAGPFTTVDDVVAAAIAGPGLIEIN